MRNQLWKLLAISVTLILAVALPGAAWATGGDATDDAAIVAPPGGGTVLPFVWNPYPQAPGPNAILYDNGPLVNAPGGGPGGADGSVLQTSLGMNTLGFGHQLSLGYRMADDFTITQAGGWQIDSIVFYAYQTGSSTTSTINDVRVQIWDGSPDNPASTVVWGDLTTNRLATTVWANIYRYSDTNPGTTRPVMSDTVTVNTVLLPGTYWLDWETGGTLTSGPWAPPITVNGSTTTGNALQYTTSWAAANDTGTGTQQGMPFVIQGSLVAPSAVRVIDVQAEPAPSPVWLLAAAAGIVLAGALAVRRAHA